MDGEAMDGTSESQAGDAIRSMRAEWFGLAAAFSDQCGDESSRQHAEMFRVDVDGTPETVCMLMFSLPKAKTAIECGFRFHSRFGYACTNDRFAASTGRWTQCVLTAIPGTGDNRGDGGGGGGGGGGRGEGGGGTSGASIRSSLLPRHGDELWLVDGVDVSFSSPGELEWLLSTKKGATLGFRCVAFPEWAEWYQQAAEVRALVLCCLFVVCDPYGIQVSSQCSAHRHPLLFLCPQERFEVCSLSGNGAATDVWLARLNARIHDFLVATDGVLRETDSKSGVEMPVVVQKLLNAERARAQSQGRAQAQAQAQVQVQVQGQEGGDSSSASLETPTDPLHKSTSSYVTRGIRLSLCNQATLAERFGDHPRAAEKMVGHAIRTSRYVLQSRFLREDDADGPPSPTTVLEIAAPLLALYRLNGRSFIAHACPLFTSTDALHGSCACMRARACADVLFGLVCLWTPCVSQRMHCERSAALCFSFVPFVFPHCVVLERSLCSSACPEMHKDKAEFFDGAAHELDFMRRACGASSADGVASSTTRMWHILRHVFIIAGVDVTVTV